MKPIIAILLGFAGILLAGCETEMPPERGKPPVSFGNDRFRDDPYERPAGLATDREKTAW